MGVPVSTSVQPQTIDPGARRISAR
jgi:hypothetical protein